MSKFESSPFSSQLSLNVVRKRNDHNFLILFILIANLFLTLPTSTFAYDSRRVMRVLPRDYTPIPVGDVNANSMTEKRYLELIDRVRSVYAPIIKSMGGSLVMENQWESPIVNANIESSGYNLKVFMHGGLSRNKLLTEDGFMMVACHEIGHRLGGPPFYVGLITSEGQADYFAGLKCMRKVLASDDNISIVANMKIDPEATKQCQEVYKSAAEIALCQRIAMAGKSYALQIGNGLEVNFSTPSKKIVNSTYFAHSDPQCRLDTLFQSALCDKSADEDVSNEDTSTGACTAKDGYKVGVRPLCWYNPREYEN